MILHRCNKFDWDCLAKMLHHYLWVKPEIISDLFSPKRLAACYRPEQLGPTGSQEREGGGGAEAAVKRRSCQCLLNEAVSPIMFEF